MRRNEWFASQAGNERAGKRTGFLSVFCGEILNRLYGGALTHFKECLICTSTYARLLVIIAILLLPFHKADVIHAQVTDKAPNPACEFQLNTLKPGVFCVSQRLEFKPGDSNSTLEQKKRDEELQNERELAYRRRKIGGAVSTVVDSAATAIKLYPYSGQCVPFARAITGIQISGAARSVPVTSRTPAVGSIVITYESSAGHAAVVTAVHDDIIHVLEGNYFHGWASERDIPIRSTAIKGYVLPNS